MTNPLPLSTLSEDESFMSAEDMLGSMSAYNPKKAWRNEGSDEESVDLSDDNTLKEFYTDVLDVNNDPGLISKFNDGQLDVSAYDKDNKRNLLDPNTQVSEKNSDLASVLVDQVYRSFDDNGLEGSDIDINSWKAVNILGSLLLQGENPEQVLPVVESMVGKDGVYVTIDEDTGVYDFNMRNRDGSFTSVPVDSKGISSQNALTLAKFMGLEAGRLFVSRGKRFTDYADALKNKVGEKFMNVLSSAPVVQGGMATGEGLVSPEINRVLGGTGGGAENVNRAISSGLFAAGTEAGLGLAGKLAKKGWEWIRNKIPGWEPKITGKYGETPDVEAAAQLYPEAMESATSFVKQGENTLGVPPALFAAQDSNQARSFVKEKLGQNPVFAKQIDDLRDSTVIQLHDYMRKQTIFKEGGEETIKRIEKAGGKAFAKQELRRKEAGEMLGKVVAGSEAKLDLSDIVNDLENVTPTLGKTEQKKNAIKILSAVRGGPRGIKISKLEKDILSKQKEKAAVDLEHVNLPFSEGDPRLITQGKVISDKSNALKDEIEVMEGQLGDLYKFTLSEANELKTSINATQRSHKQTTGEALIFPQILSKLNSKMDEAAETLGDRKSAYRRIMDEINTLEESSLGVLLKENADVNSADRFGNFIFSLADKDEAKRTLNLLRQEDPQAYRLVAKTRLARLLTFDKAARAETKTATSPKQQALFDQGVYADPDEVLKGAKKSIGSSEIELLTQGMSDSQRRVLADLHAKSEILTNVKPAAVKKGLGFDDIEVPGQGVTFSHFANVATQLNNIERFIRDKEGKVSAARLEKVRRGLIEVLGSNTDRATKLASEMAKDRPFVTGRKQDSYLNKLMLLGTTTRRSASKTYSDSWNPRDAGIDPSEIEQGIPSRFLQRMPDIP